MKQFKLFLIIVVLGISYGLPVTKNEQRKEEKLEENKHNDIEGVLEYERYLKEVVNALESDPEFRKKLDNATEADVRTGKIALELEYVSHHVRTKLDEIKRREMERLRHLAIKQYELTNDIDRDHFKISEHEHIDHDNQHTFEIEDLKKLILKTSLDLAEADKDRREEFKEYELQKEFEKQEKLRTMDEEHKKQYEDDLKKQQEKHNVHEKVHHPGNKAQLEEVWEKQDHMEAGDFDPKTFFMMHDVDGNNFWDETEVKALFVKELDKVYQAGLPEDDMRERVEEMERMREHVFKEADTNHDNLISFEEFIEQTKKEEFQQDPGWNTVDNTPQFTHEEYMEFERKRQEEINRLIAQGVLPPNPHGAYNHYEQQQQQHHQQQQQYQQQQQQYQQQQQQQYQQQQQQQHQQQYQPAPPPQYQQPPQQQYHQPPPQFNTPIIQPVLQQNAVPNPVLQQNAVPNTVPQQNAVPNPVPQQNDVPNPVPQQNVVPNPVPPQNSIPNTIPQQNQLPSQQKDEVEQKSKH